MSPPQTQSTPKWRERFPSNSLAIDPNVGGVLTIYTNHPGGNLVQKHKTIRFAVVGERAATKYPQISVTGSPLITAQFSEASQTEMREPFVFPTEIFLPTCGKNFPVFPCKL